MAHELTRIPTESALRSWYGRVGMVALEAMIWIPSPPFQFGVEKALLCRPRRIDIVHAVRRISGWVRIAGSLVLQLM
jgi:hypothetical protein